MIKFVKLTLAHNEQPIYVNVASIESFRAHVTDDKEDGSYVSTTSMRVTMHLSLLKRHANVSYHMLYWEEIGDDGKSE